VLSSQERRIWQDIERWDAEIGDALPGTPPTAPAPAEDRGVDDLPAVVVCGIWAGIILILFGLVLAGLAVGAVTVLGALVWRYWPLRG